MSQAGYFLSKNGGSEKVGPFTAEQVIERLNTGELVMTDFVYDESVHDWVLVLQCAGVQQVLKARKPTTKPGAQQAGESQASVEVKATLVTAPNGADWYLLKGANQIGPFHFADVVKKLQDKEAFNFDMVWRTGWEDWKRIAEVTDFSPENIRNLPKEVAKKVFRDREYDRAKWNAKLLVHNNNEIWKGQSIELSEGGAGLVIRNALLVPGDQVFVHFYGSNGLPTFNAQVQIVGKRYAGVLRGRDAPVTYDVKFENLNETARKAIRGKTGEKKAA